MRPLAAIRQIWPCVPRYTVPSRAPAIDQTEVPSGSPPRLTASRADKSMR